MKLIKFLSATVLALGLVSVGYASKSTYLVPFSDIIVKAGSKVYIYYGGIGLSNSVICKSKGKGHVFSGSGAGTAPTWENTGNDLYLTTQFAAESGMFKFAAGSVDAVVSCDYQN